jgi:tRNA 2-selenouridine synthase
MKSVEPGNERGAGPTIKLEEIDFTRYAMVIDARSPHEFADDHIPGAVNLPVVVDEEFAEVGRTYKADPHAAYVIGASFAMRNIAEHLERRFRGLASDSRFLIYCYRGGKRSQAWAQPLRAIGFHVDVLQGGWKEYRRAVLAALSDLPKRFTFRVVGGATGCGKTRLLQALRQAGEQVIDLEGLAAHKGSLLGLMPGHQQPPQKLFDSELLRALLALDTAHPAWIEAESKKVGNVQLPDALFAAMRKSMRFEIRAPLVERVRLLREEYPHLVRDPLRVVAQLAPLKALVGGKELDEWTRLARAGDVDALVARLLVSHYDPSYGRSHERYRDGGMPPVDIELSSLSADELVGVARQLASRYGRPAAASARSSE